MISARDQYTELLTLTKNYLLQEYSLKDRILSESETYFYFKSHYRQKNSSQSSEKPPPPPSSKPISTIQQPFPLISNEKIILPQHTSPLVENWQPPSKPENSALPPAKKANIPEPSKTVSSTQKNARFKLEPPQALPPMNFSDLRKIFHEKCTHIQLLDQVPDDTQARALAKTWMQEKISPQVLILSFDEVPKHLAFLNNIAKALEVYGIRTSLKNAFKLEQEAKWGDLLKPLELKLIIASSSGFYHLSKLQKYYKEGTKQGRYYLGDCLLLLLSDIGFYFKEPTLKSSLWSGLQEHLEIVPIAT